MSIAATDATSNPPPEIQGEPIVRGRRRSVRIAFQAILLLLGLSVLAVCAALFWALWDVNWSTIAIQRSDQRILLQDKAGSDMVPSTGYQARFIERNGFPEHLVKAVLAAEDRRFYDHGGIDLVGILRAARSNLSAGDIVAGGSTITQQLVKMRYLTSERTFKRKLQEIVIAAWLETRISKDEILTRYLNTVYMGSGATGMQAAALVYFGKDLKDIGVAEAAMLAATIRSPSKVNPRIDPAAARHRGAAIIQLMVESGFLDAGEGESASVELERVVAQATPPRGGWYADWAIERAQSASQTLTGSVSARTAFDPQLQAMAEAAIRDQLAGVKNGPDQAAMVVMRPDGAVVAMVGGVSYEPGGFNRAVAARRQPGSTFKLFVYYAALKAGFRLQDVVEDAPIEIKDWAPRNFGDEYFGRVTLAEAFARSLNAAAVRLAQEVGIEKVMDAARELGLDAPLSPNPSLALGTSEVTLLDLTSAYAAVRAGAAPIEPFAITELHAGDRTFRMAPAKPKRALGRTRGQLIQLLRLVVERGTGRGAAIKGFAAGKTGTTQDHRDAWFIGFTDTLVVGVWVGNDDNRPMDRVTGGSLPAKIWKQFMEGAQADSTLTAGVDTSLTTAAIGDETILPREDDGSLCDVNACSRRYRSFRAEDCTYKPRGRPRQLCPIGATPDVSDLDDLLAMSPEEATTAYPLRVAPLANPRATLPRSSGSIRPPSSGCNSAFCGDRFSP